MSPALYALCGFVAGGAVAWSACAGWKSRRPRNVLAAGILEPPPKRPKFVSIRGGK